MQNIEERIEQGLYGTNCKGLIYKEKRVPEKEKREGVMCGFCKMDGKHEVTAKEFL